MDASLGAKFLDRTFDPLIRGLTTDAARLLADLRADPTLQRRIDELAKVSTEGRLSSAELAEYEAYLSAANVVAILQRKARCHLVDGTTS